ncbi:hypothetical protein K474DRAFT_1680180 [Panus rudis PR-1116 ss-1]|nr:hypothetical protein K474DRAFT_1680180 [Panus rudis PR-1116 ss-1]
MHLSTIYAVAVLATAAAPVALTVPLRANAGVIVGMSSIASPSSSVRVQACDDDDGGSDVLHRLSRVEQHYKRVDNEKKGKAIASTSRSSSKGEPSSSRRYNPYGATSGSSSQQPSPDDWQPKPYDVTLHMGKNLLSNNDKMREITYSHVENHIRRPPHTNELKAAEVVDIVVQKQKHPTPGSNEPAHTSWVGYGPQGDLRRGGHAYNPGTLYTPKSPEEDPTIWEKWGTLQKAQPGAAGQPSRIVNLNAPKRSRDRQRQGGSGGGPSSGGSAGFPPAPRPPPPPPPAAGGSGESSSSGYTHNPQSGSSLSDVLLDSVTSQATVTNDPSLRPRVGYGGLLTPLIQKIIWHILRWNREIGRWFYCIKRGFLLARFFSWSPFFPFSSIIERRPGAGRLAPQYRSITTLLPFAPLHLSSSPLSQLELQLAVPLRAKPEIQDGGVSSSSVVQARDDERGSDVLHRLSYVEQHHKRGDDDSKGKARASTMSSPSTKEGSSSNRYSPYATSGRGTQRGYSSSFRFSTILNADIYTTTTFQKSCRRRMSAEQPEPYDVTVHMGGNLLSKNSKMRERTYDQIAAHIRRPENTNELKAAEVVDIVAQYFSKHQLLR